VRQHSENRRCRGFYRRPCQRGSPATERMVPYTFCCGASTSRRRRLQLRRSQRPLDHHRLRRHRPHRLHLPGRTAAIGRPPPHLLLEADPADIKGRAPPDVVAADGPHFDEASQPYRTPPHAPSANDVRLARRGMRRQTSRTWSYAEFGPGWLSPPDPSRLEVAAPRVEKMAWTAACRAYVAVTVVALIVRLLNHHEQPEDRRMTWGEDAGSGWPTWR
jgi:hypothetical protein